MVECRHQQDPKLGLGRREGELWPSLPLGYAKAVCSLSAPHSLTNPAHLTSQKLPHKSPRLSQPCKVTECEAGNTAISITVRAETYPKHCCSPVGPAKPRQPKGWAGCCSFCSSANTPRILSVTHLQAQSHIHHQQLNLKRAEQVCERSTCSPHNVFLLDSANTILHFPWEQMGQVLKCLLLSHKRFQKS